MCVGADPNKSLYTSVCRAQNRNRLLENRAFHALTSESSIVQGGGSGRQHRCGCECLVGRTSLHPRSHHPTTHCPPSPSSKSKVRPYLEFLTTSRVAFERLEYIGVHCSTLMLLELEVEDGDNDNDDGGGSSIRSQLKYRCSSPDRAGWSSAAQIHHRRRLHQSF